MTHTSKAQTADDDDNVVRDGERLVVSMQMMDGVQRAVADDVTAHHLDNVLNKPGSLPSTEAEWESRAAPYRDYEQQIAERWRGQVERGEVRR